MMGWKDATVGDKRCESDQLTTGLATITIQICLGWLCFDRTTASLAASTTGRNEDFMQIANDYVG